MSTASSKPAAALERLIEIQGVSINMVVGSYPWDIEADALMIPSGPEGGPGGRGKSFELELRNRGSDLPFVASMREGQLANTDAFRERGALWVPLTGSLAEGLSHAGVEQFEGLILGWSGNHGDAIEQGTRAAIALAREHQVRQLVLPLLGVGTNKVNPREAAQDTFVALWNAPLQPLEDIVLLVPDDETANAVRQSALEPPAPPMSERAAVELRMSSDNPLAEYRDDLLGHRDYAEALAYVILNPRTVTPLTIAVNAPWGAGKTSLANMTAQKMADQTNDYTAPIVSWFNAWENDDAPVFSAALAASVARDVARERPVWRRLTNPLPSKLLTRRQQQNRRLWFGLVATTLAGVYLLIDNVFAHFDLSKLGISGLIALAALLVQKAKTVQGTATDLAGLVRSPQAIFASGSVAEVSEDLKRLVYQATRAGWHRPPSDDRRLVVFIDDIERCQPPRAIDVCEAVNHLLAHKDVVIVMLGDMRVIATSAEVKYKDLLAGGSPKATEDSLVSPRPVDLDEPTSELARSFGERYLEKVIQFRFDVPRSDRSTIRDLVHAATVGTLPSTDAPPPSAPSGDKERQQEEAASIVPRRVRWEKLVPGHLWRARRRDERQSAEIERLLRQTDIQRALREGTEEELRRLLGASENSTSDDEPRESTAVSFDALRRRDLLSRVENPELVANCFEGAANFVRPLPRDVKRLLNRIRFFLYIAEARRIMEPDGPISPAQLGKWTLLVDRWPVLASEIGERPRVLSEYESMSNDVARFDELVARLAPAYGGDAQLRAILAALPALGDDATVLGQFRRPVGPGPVPGTGKEPG